MSEQTVLVTGAAGFLGRHVVRELARAGHTVRALVRPGRDLSACRFDLVAGSGRIEVCEADLMRSDLAPAVAGVDAVVHLATAMSGSDHERFAGSLVSSERLFDAMLSAGVARIVHCSSFSVYDWLSAPSGQPVDESLPLDPAPHGSGAYAAAKVWQEKLVRRYAARGDWHMTVLRPGFIWGPGNECPEASVGRSFGPLHLVFGPRRQPCYVHVATCAAAFRCALAIEGDGGQTINLVDRPGTSAWDFMGAYLERSGTAGFRVPVPSLLLAGFVKLAYHAGRAVFGPSMKLPQLFMPANFAELYRPLRYANDAQRALLARERIPSFEARLAETWASELEEAA